MILNFDAIERRMAAKGMTQRDVADRYGRSQQAVCDVLANIRAGRHIRPATAARLVKALGMRLNDALAYVDAQFERKGSGK